MTIDQISPGSMRQYSCLIADATDIGPGDVRPQGQKLRQQVADRFRNDLERSFRSPLEEQIGSEGTRIMARQLRFNDRNGLQDVVEHDIASARHQKMRTASRSICSRNFGCRLERVARSTAT